MQEQNHQSSAKPVLSDSEEPRKRGRPKGSKTIPAEPIVEFPATCPRCGSSDIVVIPGRGPYKKIYGKFRLHATGDFYKEVNWSVCECRGCNQKLMRRRYLHRVIEGGHGNA